MARTPNKVDSIIKLRGKGASQKKIAKELGISQSTVSRIVINNKEAIKKETEKYIESLPEISEQIIRDIKTSNRLSKMLAGEELAEDLPPALISSTAVMTKFMEITYKMKSDILKAMGIYPSNINVAVQNIFQEGSNAVISPHVMNILQGKIDKELEKDKEEVIDI